MKEVGCSESTVRRTGKRFNNTGSDENIYGRGRKPALTERDIRYLGLSSMRDRRKTAAQLAEEFNVGGNTQYPARLFIEPFQGVVSMVELQQRNHF